MCICMCAHTYAYMCTNMPWRALWGSEDNLLKWVLSFCRVGLRDGTWTAKLGDRYLPWVIQRKKLLQKEELERHVKSGSLPTPMHMRLPFLSPTAQDGRTLRKKNWGQQEAGCICELFLSQPKAHKVILPSTQGLPQHMRVPHTHTVYLPSTVREFSAMDAYPAFARIPLHLLRSSRLLPNRFFVTLQTELSPASVPPFHAPLSS